MVSAGHCWVIVDVNKRNPYGIGLAGFERIKESIKNTLVDGVKRCCVGIRMT